MFQPIYSRMKMDMQKRMNKYAMDRIRTQSDTYIRHKTAGDFDSPDIGRKVSVPEKIKNFVVDHKVAVGAGVGIVAVALATVSSYFIGKAIQKHFDDECQRAVTQTSSCSFALSERGIKEQNEATQSY